MTDATRETTDTKTIRRLAAEAFIYGFPLVFNLGQMKRFVREGIGQVPGTPFNRFGHATTLAGPETRFVSINNDTVYSVAAVDVTGGPVLLDVPDAGGRYYVLQFVDAWTNNFAYIGHRSTGTAAASFLLVPSGWSGEPPAGTRVVRCPTGVVMINGRWAIDAEEDLPAVRTLQRGLVLTGTAPGTAPGSGVPDPDPGVSRDLVFLEQLRTWMQAFPAAERDRRYEERFAPLGLLRASCPYREVEADLGAALRDGLAEGRRQLEVSLRDAPNPRQNGWDLTYHVFDYNLDFFEVGTLDDERWKLPEGPLRYLVRAGSARGGLWGNHGYEAAYPMVYVDADGNPLTGEHSYALRFDTPPPCSAFWSVTMYDATDFFLVDNPAHRYSIGDRTPGLVYGKDGSLTIAFSHEEPAGEAAQANWLPTPRGEFRPLLRIYEPDDAVFDGRWQLPPIRRTS